MAHPAWIGDGGVYVVARPPVAEVPERLGLTGAATRSTQEVMASNIVDRLRARADAHPDALLYRFLETGDVDGAQQCISYGEVERRARAVAALLQEGGLSGKPVLLLFAPGIDYIVGLLGCMFAGAIGVPTYLPNPAHLHRSLPRFRALWQSAGVEAVMALRSTAMLCRQVLGAEMGEIERLRWIATDAALLEPGLESAWRAPQLGGDRPAFLQYTSGSTSQPRGVIVSHRNLLANIELAAQQLAIAPSDRGVSWLPPYHDMGLITFLLGAPVVGAETTLFSPLDFLSRPMRWLQAISRFGATFSGGPNFAYELACRRATPEACEGLDLRSWSVAFSGAEPIRADTLDRFADTFARFGFSRRAFAPGYGLAEATLVVAVKPRDEAPTVREFDAADLAERRVARPAPGKVCVSVGPVVPETDLRVVDPATRRALPDGHVGELWLRGPSVAAGFWRDEVATAESYHATLDEPDSPRFLRTGDLGFVVDGQVYITARLKDLIIVRGRNLAPQDLERTAELAHRRIRPGCAAAFELDEGTGDRVALVAEVDAGASEAELAAVAEAVREAVLSEHEVRLDRIALVARGAIPKTSSGKLQRGACRAALAAGELPSLFSLAAPLAERPPEPPSRALADELRACRPADRIGVMTAFLQSELARAAKSAETPDAQATLVSVGLDSLGWAELREGLHRQLGVTLPEDPSWLQHSIAQVAAIALVYWGAGEVGEPTGDELVL